MQEAMISLLAGWGTFYSIVGTAAATLTGLVFIVLTLIAGRPRTTRTDGAIAAFATPNVVHFCTVLLITATLSAPWPSLSNIVLRLLLGLIGVGGIAYVIVIIRRTRSQIDYQLVLEDWIWHIILTSICYLALAIAALLLPGNPTLALFFIGAIAVLLLLIGIHNAWDSLTYNVIEEARSMMESRKEDKQ